MGSWRGVDGYMGGLGGFIREEVSEGGSYWCGWIAMQLMIAME